MLKTRRLGTLALVLLLSGVSTAQTVPPNSPLGALDKNLKDGLASISPAEAYDIVKTLARPEYAGRLTGHPGYTAAAQWAAKKLAAWGLKPISGKDGYLQPYASPYTVIDKAEMTILLPDGPPDPAKAPAYKEMKLVPEKDFLPLLYSDSGDRTAETVFAGWGISAPEIGYDDYAGLDVKGKFVLCFRGTPDNDPKYQHYDEHRTRMKTATGQGRPRHRLYLRRESPPIRTAISSRASPPADDQREGHGRHPQGRRLDHGRPEESADDLEAAHLVPARGPRSAWPSRRGISPRPSATTSSATSRAPTRGSAGSASSSAAISTTPAPIWGCSSRAPTTTPAAAPPAWRPARPLPLSAASPSARSSSPSSAARSWASRARPGSPIMCPARSTRSRACSTST